MYVVYLKVQGIAFYVGEAGNLLQRLTYLFRCHRNENPHPCHLRYRDVWDELPECETFCEMFGVCWHSTKGAFGRLEAEEGLQTQFGTNVKAFYMNFEERLAANQATPSGASPQAGPPALMALPTFTTPAVVPVNTGALNRLFDIVQMIKQHGSFTETIGSDLGAAQSGPNFTTLRPEITAAVAGSGVQLGWGGYARHLDPCGIYVDRGSCWGPLAQDSTPGYTDTTPHPATPPKWKYKSIYRVDDAQVGIWSAGVNVIVGG